VDKAIPGSTSGIHAQESMPGMQAVAKLGKLIAQSLGTIVPVMKVDLHFSTSTGAQICQQIDANRVVLFLRVEKRLLRTFAVCVQQTISRFLVAIAPPPDQVPGFSLRIPTTKRLEMICYAENEMLRPFHVPRSLKNRLEVPY
jgi:hypothetical protein